jgi:hypothetical protein
MAIVMLGRQRTDGRRDCAMAGESERSPVISFEPDNIQVMARSLLEQTRDTPM